MTAAVFVVPPTVLAGARAGDGLTFDGPEGRHAATVRRLGVGEPVRLVDGDGRYADATVARVVDPSTVEVTVVRVADEPEPAPRLIVVQALAKGDRGERAVEMLTEVGVDEIVPWAAERCVTQWRGDKVERGHRRWVDTAYAAAKQSRRTRFPQVATLAATSEVSTRIAAAAVAIVLHEDADTPIGEVALPPAGDVLLVVGPEGGLSAAERSVFAVAGAREARLGPTVLRTSTAGVVAAAAVLAACARWRLTGPGPDARMGP